MFEVLLGMTSNVNLAGHFGIIPFKLATQINEERLIYRLLENRADKSIKTEHGHKAYDYALKNSNMKLAEILK